MSCTPSFRSSIDHDVNGSHQSPDATSFGQLHYDPHSWPIHHTPIILDHVRHDPILPCTSHQLLQEADLLLDISDIIILRVQVDDLQGDDMSGGAVLSSVDSAVGSFTDDLQFLI